MCPVCQERLAVDDHVLMSGCLHALCGRCADQATLAETRAARCPVCEVDVTAGVLRSHPLVLSALQANGSANCAVCQTSLDVDEPAVSHCADCHLYLCSVHTKLHAKSATAASHTVRALAAAATTVMCAQHGLVVSATCSCTAPLCVTCIAEHARNGHSPAPLDAAYRETAHGQLHAAVTMATSSSMPESVARAVDAELSRRSTSDALETAERDIRHACALLHEAVDQRQQVLLEEVAGHREAAQRACATVQEADRARWAALASAVEVGAHVVSDSDAESLSLPLLAQLTPVVVQRLSSLSASVAVEAVPLGRPWRFVLDGDLDVQIARAGRLEARP